VWVDDIVAGLDDRQREAVTAPPSPLVVVAGAGSGKTTVLTRRVAMLVARGDVDPRHVLAVTHTTKAAAEIGQRLAVLDGSLRAVSSSTVHAAAWRIVRRFPNECGFDTEPSLVSSTFPLIREAFRAAVGGPLDPAELLDLAAELDWAAAQGVDGPGYRSQASAAGRNPAWSLQQVADVFEAFRGIKRARNVADFGDVLAAATVGIDDADVAARVHNGWRAVVVDEFQDTDRAQAAFLSKVRAGRPLWNVVGDPRQTIYSFKGADPSLLRAEMRAAGTTVVHLQNSWRCSSEILGWANAAIGSNYGPPLVSDLSGPPPSLVWCDTADDEPVRIVDQLRAWRSNGVRYEEMAVLFRFNAASARLEVALAEADIPYATADGKGFFERPEILAILRPFGARSRSWPEDDGMALLRTVAASTGFDEASPPEGHGAVRSRWESVRSLLEIAESCSDHAAGPLLAELLSLAASGGPGGVTLATIHAAKGLEWRAVCVAGVTEGSLPSLYATTPDQIEEERRLFYVALTRAARSLVLFVPKRFRNMPVRPSRFLRPLPGVSLPSAAGSGSGRSRSARGGSRATGSSRGEAGASRPAARSASAGGASSSSSSRPSGLGAGGFAEADPPVVGAVPAPDSISSCKQCGERLRWAAARQSKVCGGLCLVGPERDRYNRFVIWRDQQHPGRIDDRELFHLTVVGVPGHRWPKDIHPPSDI
jgi:DNA helicase II / ATP-dependent DNA helicase PcrA